MAVDSPMGMTVGYPISQCAMLIAGMWGVFYYKEIRENAKIMAFALSTIVVCTGAAVLGIYGSCTEDA